MAPLSAAFGWTGRPDSACLQVNPSGVSAKPPWGISAKIPQGGKPGGGMRARQEVRNLSSAPMREFHLTYCFGVVPVRAERLAASYVIERCRRGDVDPR